MRSPVNGSLRLADLHVHTARSTCYADRSVTAGQIVNAAIAFGLDVIAVTDHNAVDGIDGIREAARRKGLFVFPGVELSTREGHVVAIFDLDTPVNTLEDFLDSVGIGREGRGDAHTLTADGMETVLCKTAERGGLSILAHIERWPSGFLETRESRLVKARIHASQHLNALEITIPQNKPLWNEGRVWSYPTGRACIQASDAHSLAEIGRRPVYIDMPHVDLAALRVAFLEYRTRIFFPDEQAPAAL